MALLALLLVQVLGCATSKDLEAVRVEMGDKLSATRKAMEGQIQASHQQLEGMARQVGTMQTRLDRLGTEQTARIEAIRQTVGTSLADLQRQVATLTQLRKDVQDVRADVALLKQIGVALESIKGQLDTTTATVDNLRAEAKTQESAIASLQSELQEFKSVQEAITKETVRLHSVIGTIGQGVTHGLQVELNLARERVAKLEEALKRFQPTELDGKAETPLPERAG